MRDIKKVEKASQAAVISLKKIVLKLAEVKNIIDKVSPKNIPAEEFLFVINQAHKGLITAVNERNPPNKPAEIAPAKMSL